MLHLCAMQWMSRACPSRICTSRYLGAFQSLLLVSESSTPCLCTPVPSLSVYLFHQYLHLKQHSFRSPSISSTKKRTHFDQCNAAYPLQQSRQKAWPQDRPFAWPLFNSSPQTAQSPVIGFSEAFTIFAAAMTWSEYQKQIHLEVFHPGRCCACGICTTTTTTKIPSLAGQRSAR